MNQQNSLSDPWTATLAANVVEYGAMFYVWCSQLGV
jgi:hypothetical protein